MSPLLSMRAPVSVNVRLLGACGVTGLVAVIVAVVLVALWSQMVGPRTATNRI